MDIYEINSARAACKIEGKEFPAVGFGTYPLTGKLCIEAVQHAAESGYRIIDTATYYRNFDAIATALKGWDRRHFYLISKVWHDMQSPPNLHWDLEKTLKLLQTDYLDAYLLHWPNSTISIESALTTLNELRKNHKIRHIGLSNVSVNHLKRALEVGVPLVWVQVEMHPHFYDAELLKFCREHKIGVQAWAPLGRGRLCTDALLEKIGKKYGKTPSQIAVRWIIQHGCIPLPGSKNERHIRENIDVGNFALSKEEISEIDQKARVGKRERFSKETIGFTDEFDFSYQECWPQRLPAH